jgi:hypothetical protein
MVQVDILNSCCDVRDSEYPAEWEITRDLMHHFAKHTPSQNIESDLFLNGISFGDKVRYARKDYFVRRLTNGEIVQRDW